MAHATAMACGNKLVWTEGRGGAANLTKNGKNDLLGSHLLGHNPSNPQGHTRGHVSGMSVRRSVGRNWGG
jgi:hypothetical protein